MQVLRRVTKSKQYLQLLKAHPFFDFPSRASHYDQWRNYCIKLLETGTATQYSYLHGSNSEAPQKHRLPPSITPNPSPTIDSAEDSEAIYNRIYQFIAEDDEAVLPAGWVLSMVQRCRTYYDIKLLIFLLVDQQLLLKNPDEHLTQEITRACLRCGALLYAQSTMYNPNTFGFTPNKGSALLLLNYAEDHDDVELMEEAFGLVETSNFPVDPDIAEIILRIYRNVNRYDKLLFYAQHFITGEVKLNQSSLEMLMESAANKGDVVSLREYESAISKIINRHTFRSGFAYAKGLLLDGEPEVAAHVIIELLRQYMLRDEYFFHLDTKSCADDFPDDLLAFYRKKCSPWPEELMIEIQKLVEEWPTEIIKLRISAKKKKERIATLKSCIPKMVEYLSTKGFELKLNLDRLNKLGNDWAIG